MRHGWYLLRWLRWRRPSLWIRPRGFVRPDLYPRVALRVGRYELEYWKG